MRSAALTHALSCACLRSPRAALARGLSNSSATRSRLERPPIPRFAPRRSVRDRFRPLATAQLRSPFPTSPHLRAAFTLQHQRARNCRRPAYKASRRADACATVCNHLRLTDLAPLPNLAALFSVSAYDDDDYRISDPLFKVIIYSSLPPSWDAFTQPFVGGKKGTATYDPRQSQEFIGILMEEYKRRQIRAERSDTSACSDVDECTREPEYDCRHLGKPRCDICGKWGHIKKDCWSKGNQKRKSDDENTTLPKKAKTERANVADDESNMTQQSWGASHESNAFDELPPDETLTDIKGEETQPHIANTVDEQPENDELQCCVTS
ncbi:hypothetical protein EDB84DRAFT_1573250 [Lactarius hengduanensis]|nr:hypothetical protein EDB84DRAFT_1573250 [Lactarius hengduanensis]